MGIYLTSYAIDLAEFEAAIEQSMASAMWFYIEQSTDDWIWNYRIFDQCWFCASPEKHSLGRGLFRGPGSPKLTEDEAFTDSHLSIRVKDFLLGENGTFALSSFLCAMSECPSAGWIHGLDYYGPRFLVGFLTSVEKSELLSNADYDQLVAIFQKALRGFSTAWGQLSDSEFVLTDFDFPVLPIHEADDEYQMGVWTKDEVEFVIRQIRFMLNRGVRFGPPPSFLETYTYDQEDLDEWHEVICEVLEKYLELEKLDFQQLRIVSFIG